MPFMDNKTTFESVRHRVEEFRDERDWSRFHNPKDLAMALSIEASELEELFLWKNRDELDEFTADRRNLERVREEVADICIYLLSLSSVLKIDLSDSIIAKLAKNAGKYPISRSKGSSKKYNELPP